MSTAVDGFITDTERREFEKANIRIQSEKYFKRITPRQLTRGVSQGTISIADARAALASQRMPESDIRLLLNTMMSGAGDEGDEES